MTTFSRSAIARVKRPLLALAVACLGLCTSPAAAQDTPHLATGKDVNRGLVQIIVLTKDENGKIGLATGTGFVINDKSVIITNRHVIENAVRIYVNPDGQLMNLVEDTAQRPNAELVWSSESLDLAILQASGLHNIAPLVITTSLPPAGDPVLAIGYPGAADRDDFKGGDIKSIATITSGVFSRKILSSWRAGSRPLEIIQHSAAISWGNSGGPLLDSCRRVIGVNSQLSLKGRAFNEDTAGNLTEGVTAAEGIYYASAISELLEILKEREIAVTSVSGDPCEGGQVVASTTSQNPSAAPSGSGSSAQTQTGSSNSSAPSSESAKPIATVFGVALTPTILAALGLVVVLLLLGLVLVLRRPRAYVVQGGGSDVRGKTRALRGRTIAIGAADLTGIPILELSGAGIVLRIIPDDFANGPVIVGRDPPVDRFALNDPSVSREHFSVEPASGKLYLRDLNSTNGTLLDGARVDPSGRVELQAGQTISAGSVKLAVRFT